MSDPHERPGRRYPALAWYRLWKLDRRHLQHFLVAVSALIIGLVFHIKHVAGMWVLLPVGIVLIFELYLLIEEFMRLATPSDTTLVEADAFAEISPTIRSASLPDTFKYEEYVFVKRADGSQRPIEGVLRSRDVDEWLLLQKPHIELVSRSGFEKQTLQFHRPHLHDAFEYLLARLRQRRYPRLTNEAKITLRTDLSARPNKALVGRTCYFTSCLTNDASTRKLSRKTPRGEFPYANLTSMFPLVERQGKARVLDLGESTLSNHIGASTVALFQQVDGKCFLIFPIQNAKAARSGLLYAPTGSGSLDWNDFQRSAQQDLLSVVRYGVQRELCEEQSLVGLHQDAVRLGEAIDRRSIRTLVLGHFRWMTIGGLPQFCCFSTAKVDSVQLDLRPSPNELEIHGADNPLPQHPRAIASLQDLKDECLEMLSSFWDDLSVPLLVNLDLIHATLSGQYGAQAQAVLERFIADAVPTIR
jgi:hypothetical protein